MPRTSPQTALPHARRPAQRRAGGRQLHFQPPAVRARRRAAGRRPGFVEGLLSDSCAAAAGTPPPPPTSTPTRLEEDRLKGVHGDARVCSVARGVHVVVAPPVPAVAPVHLQAAQAKGRQARLGENAACRHGDARRLCSSTPRGKLRPALPAAKLRPHRRRPANVQAWPCICHHSGRAACACCLLGAHPAVHGHQGCHVVAVLHERVGEPVLPLHHHPLVAQLAGAQLRCGEEWVGGWVGN